MLHEKVVLYLPFPGKMTLHSFLLHSHFLSLLFFCLAEFGSLTLDVVYVLQHYKDMWESNQWVEKFEIEPCHEKHRYRFT
jgi:hypothetical protein